MRTLPPGSTIGIIGGGQLARMLSMAAAQLGYRCHIFAPEASGPAADVAARWVQGAYDDRAALAAFAAGVDVVTFEFENIDPAALAGLPVFPAPEALATAQDRVTEKTFAAAHGARTAPWAAVDSRADLDAAIVAIGTPAILKTRRFGYDGKGQARLASPADADAAWDAIGGQPAILEGMVAFEHEFSLIIAHGQDGRSVTWTPPVNVHRDGILRTATVPPPPVVLAHAEEARTTATRIADALGYVGVLTIEFFASADGPVFNEMAPRVHNSGHWTIEGALTSQFENHIRAVVGLPLGPTGLVGNGAVMTNLIGADIDAWGSLAAEPGAHLHLYGKHQALPGRKMGHVTRLAARGSGSA